MLLVRKRAIFGLYFFGEGGEDGEDGKDVLNRMDDDGGFAGGRYGMELCAEYMVNARVLLVRSCEVMWGCGVDCGLWGGFGGLCGCVWTDGSLLFLCLSTDTNFTP
jgi:hypothetical protein